MAVALRGMRTTTRDPATIPLTPASSRYGDPGGTRVETEALPDSTRSLTRLPLWAWAIAAAVIVIAGVWVAAAGRDPRPSAGSATTSTHAADLHRTIPAIGGLSFADATTKLRARQLIPQEHLVSDQAAEGTALYTAPAAGQVVPKGATVALYVSSGPPAPAPKPHHEHGNGPKKDKNKKDKNKNHGKHHGKEKHH
jgi:PASTA domain